jgi:hypothetical protein
MFGILGAQPTTNGKPPREYHFGDFWTTSFCPNFNMFSFPFIIWVINTIVYIATLLIVIIMA